MAKWRLTKSETHTLPRAKALDFAAKHAGLPKSPVERDCEKSRVKRLDQIIRNGDALPFMWATVDYEKQRLRMNGQHSSTAIVGIGADIPDRLTFHLDYYEAEDRGGMVELFRQFDQKWSSRSQSDICGAFQGIVPEIADCNKKVIKTAAEALSWCRRVVMELSDSTHGDHVYDYVHQDLYIPFFLWANSIINGRKELLKKEVMAAMWQTHEMSQSGATKFWREVSFGPDYFTDDMMPGAVLIGQLSKATDDKEFAEKEFPNRESYYKKAIKAWNAFCAGQRISSLNVTKQKGKGWLEVSRYADEPEEADPAATVPGREI